MNVLRMVGVGLGRHKVLMSGCGGAGRRCLAVVAAALALAGGATAYGQANGDFRTRQSGTWHDTNTWERFDGAMWISPALSVPTSADGVTTIRNFHSVNVTADVSIDQLILGQGNASQLNVTNGATLTVEDGAGTDFELNDFCSMHVYGGMTILTNALAAGSGGNNGSRPLITIAAGGNLAINGTLADDNGGSVPVALVVRGTATIPGAVSAVRDLYVLSGGSVAVSGSVALSSVSSLDVAAGGLLTASGTATLTGTRGNGGNVIVIAGTAILSDTATISALGVGTLSVLNGGVLELGPTAKVGGNGFVLASGGQLKIGSPAGIAASGAVGNVQNAGGRFFSAGGIYTYNGTAGQVTGNGLPAGVMGSLRIDNANGVTLSRNVTISNTLVLTTGRLITAATNNVIVATNGVVSGASAASYVSGNMQKRFAAGVGQAFTFDIGDAARYAKVALTGLNVSTGGLLQARTTGSEHPSIGTSGIASLRNANRYWTLTPSGGLAPELFDVAFHFDPADVDPLSTPLGFIVQKFSGGVWTNTATGTRTATSTQATGLDSFSEFAVGESSTALPFISVSDASVTEGDAGSVTATFTVFLNVASTNAITVDYATSNGTAVAGADYDATSGALLFPVGMTSTTLTVNVTGDVLDEHDETYTVELSNAVNGEIAGGSGTGTITDDDASPTVAIGDATVTEGDAGSTPATFTVSISTVSGRDVFVDYATSNGTAEAGLDFGAAAGTVTIPAGATSTSLTIDVTGDVMDEPDEAYTVELSNPVNVTVDDGSGAGGITDDDAAPEVSIGDATVTEPDVGTVGAEFTVSLTTASGFTVTVDYTTSNGTAEAGNDYDAASGTVTFDPGVASTTVVVQVLGDTLYEGDETYAVELSNPADATLGDGSGLGTITENEAQPSISIGDATVTEGDAGTVAMAFTVSLSGASVETVSADFVTSNGTAEAGSDYDAASGTVSFAPGVTSTTLVVTVNGDTLSEGTSEAFMVELSNPVNGALGDGSGLGTIDDDDATEVSIGDATVIETDVGTVAAEFTLTLSIPNALAVSVDYATSNGTAEAGSDYDAASGTVTFDPGMTSTTLVVLVNGDTVYEGDETFTVELSNPVNMLVDDGSGLGTITENDPQPSLSIGDATVTEPDAGTIEATFTVSLSEASVQSVSVDFVTSNGTAAAGSDYDAASGAVTFDPGVTSTTLVVTVNGDLVYEGDETFTVELSNPANGTIDDGSGLGTITENDAQPSVSIGDATVTEGDAGTVDAVYTVSVSGPSALPITVDYATSNGTAEAGLDYDAASGTVTFDPGVTSTTLVVTVQGDTVYEAADETYTVALSNPVAAAIDDGSGLGTITDDDAQPSVAIDDATVTEGDAGTVEAVFTVSLSNPSVQSVSVDFITSNGTAEAGSDYDAGSGTVTLDPGVTSTTLVVVVNGDDVDEDDETLAVELSNPVNASLGDGSGLGTIEDDDTADLGISDATVTEGDAGTAEAVFTVSLSVPSENTVTVDFVTTNITAEAGSDYDAASGTLTFDPGMTSTTIVVVVNGDLVDEGGDETFAVELSNAMNATLDDGTGVGTIQEDDASEIDIDDVTVTEGDAGTVEAIFTVTLLPASAAAVTVDFDVNDVTAEAGSDYVDAGGTLTFDPGMTSTTIVVVVNGDTLYEVSDESFTVDLSNALNATIDDLQAIGTITEDDGQPEISVDDVSVTEGNAGTTGLVFAVSLSHASVQTVAVEFEAAADTAEADVDYASLAGALLFDPGMLSTTVTVTVNGDVLDEDDETLVLHLEDENNATISDSDGLGTITDDDDEPSLTISDASVLEGDADTTNLLFVVSLSAPSGREVTVDYESADDTAEDGTDYTGVLDTLTFNPGETSLVVAVDVNGDTDNESDETLIVTLSGESNATLADDEATGVIINDDGFHRLRIGDATVTEGDAGSVAATFTVALSNLTSQIVTVDYFTTNGSAVAGLDYTAASGTLTFDPGMLSTTLTVSVLGDTLDESNEVYSVWLANAVNATIFEGLGTGTITDDDASPDVELADATVAEGDAGTTQAVFAVSLSAISGRPVTVSYATTNGTATAGSDYVAASGTVTIAAGDISTTVSVTVNGDLLDELDETFAVTLTNAIDAATITSGTAVGTIVDDDFTDPIITAIRRAVVTVPVEIDWTASSGLTYTVEATTSLHPVSPWTALAGYEAVPGTNGTMTAIDSNLTERVKIYRVGTP